MNNEQPNVVGAGTESCGIRTSVNKEYWKSKAASNYPVYSFREIRAYDELQIIVTEVGQVKQMVTLNNMPWVQFKQHQILVATTHVNIRTAWQNVQTCKNSKRSRQLSSTLMQILVSGENHNVSKLVFSLCMSECLAKLWNTVMSLLHCSPSKNFLQRQSSLLVLSYHFVMQSTDSQYLQKTCSPSTMAF